MTDALRVLLVLGLIGANAFFVVAEYAIVTVRRSALAEHRGHGAAAAMRLLDDPVRVISTVQVGITALAIVTGAVAEPAVSGMLGEDVPRPVAYVVAFAIVTYLSVVLGELVPKALALDRAATLAVLVSPSVEIIWRILAPIVWLLQRSAALVLRPFGIRDVRAGDAIATAEELRALVDEAESTGVIPLAQEELLHNVFDFVDREARDIMVPAPDVAWLDASLQPETALDQALATAHSRLPVGRGGLDRIVGVVHLRDLTQAARERHPETIEPIARPTLLVPETKDVGALLRDLREGHASMAIVIDEYGATAGLVTMEDIVEEIVGEIQDEYDLPDDTITWIDDRTLEVAGSLSIDDFNETTGVHLHQEGVRTMAGFVFARLGRRPTLDDEVEVDGVRLRPAQITGARITRLIATLPTARRPAAPASGA